MPSQRQPSTVDVLDHALKAAGTSGGNRRWLLERAAVGAAGAAAVGRAEPAPLRQARRPNSITEFGTVAVTTARQSNVTGALSLSPRHLARLGRADPVGRPRSPRSRQRRSTTSASRAALAPTTTKFWIPDAFFGGPGNTVDLTSVGKALVAGETLFVNLYLIGVTKFARAGNRKFARYSAEIAGCESEHRVLAETLLNASPPNNVGFEIYSIETPAGIESALNQAGVGFGAQGAAPGAFYKLAHPIMTPPVTIGGNKPT